MDSLVQAFSVYLEQYQNPGEGRTTKSVMTDIPTTPVGSEEGTVWLDSTILRVGTGGTSGTFVVPNLEVTTNLTVSTSGTADIDGTLNVNNTFNIDAVEVTASATELNYNDITTLGTVEANKTVTAGAAKAIDFANAPMTNVDINSGSIDGTPIGASSASTGNFSTLNATTFEATTFQIDGSTVTASAAELNYNDITSLGQVQANKVLTVDSNSIDFNNFEVTSIEITNGNINGTNIGSTNTGTGNFSQLSIAGTSITASATELNYNDITTLGTVQPSKVVTAASDGDIDFNNYNLLNVDINGGNIDGAVIGSSSASDGTFSVLEATTILVEGIKFVLPVLTTTERNAIGVPSEGWLIFNTTTNKLNFYNGTAWEQVTSS